MDNSTTQQTKTNDFSKGAVWKNILSMAVPMMIAQVIQLLYNIVDRVYIGHLPGGSTVPLTALGLTFPVITVITAFTNLFGMGGAPLCSIARGQGNIGRAEKIMGNAFAMLMITGAVLVIVLNLTMKPVLYAFGAGEETYPLASRYLRIYLLGTFFSMAGLGMNSFINSQGFGRKGMTTILIGAVANIVLDPVFIFVFHMGVQGAALATVISQGLSAFFVIKFLLSGKAVYRLKLRCLKPDPAVILRITSLGLANFIMSATNALTQVACNTMLKKFGGDLYIAVMTVLGSVRDISWTTVQGLSQGAQPVLGYNYGAKEYRRVQKGIKFLAVTSALYTTVIWILTMTFPEPFLHIFNSHPELLEAGVPALHIYFFGFFMMSLQFTGQTAFTALGLSKQAIFFSLLRKAIIVVPLTFILPYVAGLGVKGVFLAEPVSNFIGGAACFLTMYFTVYRKLGKTRSGKGGNPEKLPSGVD